MSEEMKQSKPILFVILCFLVFSPKLIAQTNEEQITAIRNASNSALKLYDIEEVLSYLTDDALTTTGNGTLLCGKKELESYILAGGKSKMYWIRDTKGIVINVKRGLAWENGTWNGYDPDRTEDPVINGKYSAMWTKASGNWKIKSQLFVSLDEKQIK